MPGLPHEVDELAWDNTPFWVRGRLKRGALRQVLRREPSTRTPVPRVLRQADLP